jgi:hypothetical protein
MNMKDERPPTRYEMRRPAAPSPVSTPPPRSRDLRREREASPDRQTRTET